jgi:hypothetical protein
MPDDQAWRRYESVARAILNTVADQFGIQRFEGKQHSHGASGTDWEIDAKGVSADGEGFVIVECRRYTQVRVTQEEVGGLAFRIHDTGATGGIIVTSIGLQEGARRAATSSNVKVVRLSQNATPEWFAMEFLGNVIVRPAGFELRSEIGTIRIDRKDNDPPAPRQ